MRFLSTAVVLSLMHAGILLAAPVIPGLNGNHPLDEAKTGHLLIEELRCAACHEVPVATTMKLAPDLSEAGSRLDLDYLKRYLEGSSQGSSWHNYARCFGWFARR
jgi:cytochrome c2